MHELEPFNLFRQILLLVVVTYTLVQLIHLIWRWHAWGVTAGRGERILRRWVVLNLLNIRIRRFTLDLIQITALAIIFLGLLWLQL